MFLENLTNPYRSDIVFLRYIRRCTILKLAFLNIYRRYEQSLLTIVLSCIAIFIALSVIVVFAMLQKGIELSEEKIGADILIISSKSEFPKSEFLYTSDPTRRYIPYEDLKFLENYEEIEQINYQFFTHTLSEGCCTTDEKTRVVGFDQEDDYIIRPWLREQNIEFLKEDEVVIGTDIALRKGDQISLLGKVFTVAGKLNRTGTGLDYTIFLDMEQARKLAKEKFSPSVFKGREVEDLVTSVYLKLKPQASIHALTENINATQDRVMAISKADSIEHIKLQIQAWRGIVGFLTVAILLLAVFSLFSRYDAMIRGRTKELGYMRAIGMSHLQIMGSCVLEILILCGFSAIISGALVSFSTPSVIRYLQGHFNFPISDFNMELIFFIFGTSAVLSISLSLISGLIPTFKINSMQPKDAMNRGEL